MIEPQKYWTSQNRRLASRIICEYLPLSVVLRAMFLVTNLLCIGCGVFDPYKQCDESLELGEERTFTITGPNQVDKEEGDCSTAVPFDVGALMHLSIDDFVGGEMCDSASGNVTIQGGPELEWTGGGGGAKHAAHFRGDYEFEVDGCPHECHLEFQESAVRYYNCS